MTFDPVIPIPWIVLIAAIMLGSGAWFQFRSARHLGFFKNTFLLVTRLLALAITVLLLLQPVREEKIPVPSRKKSILFAIDNSASMAEPHSTGSSRLDAVRADLETAGVFTENDDTHQFYTFSEKIAPQTPDSIRLLPPNGQTTRFDTSINALLRASVQPPPAGIIVLSDGHDFDLIPPSRTAATARARDIPIFTIPYGTSKSARDVTVSIANYHPHTFIRQSTRLEAFIRTFGTPHENITVDLMRDGQKVDSKTFDSGNDSFHNVAFDVSHEEAGQYEYTFRLAPVANEQELSNNTATTYLNVISERIRILEIEGTPFWDSTFLRRSFARNDKFDIDSLVAFTGDRVRPIRSNPERSAKDLKAPATVDDFKPYNIVVLGREADRVIGLDGIRALEKWVKNENGILIFSRGRPWFTSDEAATNLEPIEWDIGTAKGTRLEVTPQASSVSAFNLLRETAATDNFPEVITFNAAGAPKTLATTFSVDSSQSPAIVYRRYGDGQTLSLGVGNLWRWVFNPKAEYDNNAYDRFWDQLALWLLSNGGVSPIEGLSLRGDTTNLPLGETIHFRLSAHGMPMPSPLPSITIYRDTIPVTTLTPTASENDSNLALTDFTPRATGRFQAEIKTADGKLIQNNFIVFRESLETTETAIDTGYLRQLATASGGRMIEPTEIPTVIEELLRETTDQEPLIRRTSLWDNPWIYALLCLLFALDWYSRRRWGLT
ncbi:MAG: hypothetical protein ACSHX7_12355 [Luteolibacter sp.]